MSIDRAPARPIREFLVAWAITTGDSIERIAIGFDLDPALVGELLGPEPPRMLDLDIARIICRKLRAHPAELWPRSVANAVGEPSWATEPLLSDVVSKRYLLVVPFAGR